MLLGTILNDSYATAAHLPQPTLGSAPAGTNASPQSSHRDSKRAISRAVEAAKNGYVNRAAQCLTIIEPSREAIVGMRAVVTKIHKFISALDPETYASKNATRLSLVIGSFEFSFVFKDGTTHHGTRNLFAMPSQEDLIKKAMFLVADFFDKGLPALLRVAIFVYKATVLLMVVFALHLVGFRIRPEGLSHETWNIIN